MKWGDHYPNLLPWPPDGECVGDDPDSMAWLPTRFFTRLQKAVTKNDVLLYVELHGSLHPARGGALWSPTSDEPLVPWTAPMVQYAPDEEPEPGLPCPRTRREGFGRLRRSAFLREEQASGRIYRYTMYRPADRDELPPATGPPEPITHEGTPARVPSQAIPSPQLDANRDLYQDDCSTQTG